jgi:hypothetical protein
MMDTNPGPNGPVPDVWKLTPSTVSPVALKKFTNPPDAAIPSKSNVVRVKFLRIKAATC